MHPVDACSQLLRKEKESLVKKQKVLELGLNAINQVCSLAAPMGVGAGMGGGLWMDGG